MRSAPLLLLALLLGGCCGRRSTPSRPAGPALDLGTVHHPPAPPQPSPALHAWSARRPQGTYRLGYGLSPAERASIDKAFADFAREVRFERKGDSAFTWHPPKGCQGSLRCVHEHLARRSLPAVAPLVALFRKRQAQARLTALDLAGLVVSFVQEIRYEIPKERPFGVLPPALVASEKRGDCDSKSLLAHMLLSELSIRSILVSSTAHKHAMLGIALPVNGTKIRHEGTDYFFTEMTARNSPIGHINPKLLMPDDWRPVPVRVR